MKEDATNEAGVTIDSRVYNITVMVTDYGAGTLSASVTGADITALNFVNSYKPDTPPPQTGDDSHVLFSFILMVLAEAVLIGLLIVVKKQSKEDCSSDVWL